MQTLHGPTHGAEGQQRVNIAPLARPLEGADEHNRQDQRHDDRVAEQGDLGELVGKGEAETGAEDIGDGHGPDHGIGHVQMLCQHVRSGNQAMDQEGAEQNGHGGRPRHTEGDGGDQGPAFLRVVGSFGSQHAADITLAEGLRRAGLGTGGMAVGDPIDDGGPKARDGAESGPQPSHADDQPPMDECVLDALPLTSMGIHIRRFCFI